MSVNLPFERLPGFIVWYLDRKFPIAIPAGDVKMFIDDTSFGDPMQSMNLKMAIFEGVGHFQEVKEAAMSFTKKLKRKISENGWPYAYKFYSSQAFTAFEAYITVFCFINNNIVAEKQCTSIDGQVVYRFYLKKIFKKKELLSFSQNAVASVIGPSVEFFVGLTSGDYLYFGQGSIKRLFPDELGSLSAGATYQDLMTASYNRR